MARKKRADGRVQVVIDIGKENGERKRKYFYGRTLTEARAKRDAWLEEQERKTSVAEPDVTLARWSQLWLESVKDTTELSTYKARASAARAQNAVVISGVPFGDMAIKNILPMHVQTYMNALSGYSRGMISYRRGVIKSILASAVANGIIPSSPWQAIRSPKGSYTGHRALSPAERRMIEDTAHLHRAGAWALVMAYTGMRREELVALEAQDVDLDGKQIHIQRAAVLKEGSRTKQPKTEAGTRTIPIFAQIENTMRLAIGNRKHGRVFTSAAGEPLTESSFKQAWRSYMIVLERYVNGIEPYEHTIGFRRTLAIKAAERAGEKYVQVEPFTPHDLRYTFATILYDAGVDVKTAAYLLGHADITVTMKIYTKLSEEKKASGIDALTEYMRLQSSASK